jgi:flavin reductase (DIM6/NTAB) family NADH-FMN oxidoreductase RutF
MSTQGDWYSYEPQKGHGLPHDPLDTIVGPRPIGWISTVGEAGSFNLAPYSFFSLFNYRPPILGDRRRRRSSPPQRREARR